MPSNKYNVSDYKIFDDAVSITNNLNNKLSEEKDNITSSESKISDDTFKGPAADQAKEYYDKIAGYLSVISNNLNNINNYFQRVSSNYKEADQQAREIITNTSDSDGTSLSYVSSSGRSYSSSSLGSSNRSYSSSATSDSQQEFINSIKDGAIESYEKYHVLPSLTLAQAILESGWGKYSIGNNLFGIKAGSGWTGKTQNVATTEYDSNGRAYHITDTFRDYDSISDSIEDHAKLLTNSRYDSVRSATDYKTACHEVQKDGYATSPAYADSLIELIEQYDLDQWDNVSI